MRRRLTFATLAHLSFAFFSIIITFFAFSGLSDWLLLRVEELGCPVDEELSKGDLWA
jgi:hypothetical protein